MIHVYAFVDDLRRLPELDGVDGAPLERRQLDGFDAVLSRRSRLTTEASLRRDALAHGGVVEALVDLAACVLPVRFGEEPDDDRELARTVAERSSELRRSRDRVRGCVEVGLRVSGTESRGRPVASGAAYMHALRSVELERRRTIGGLHAELSGLARETRVEPSIAAGSGFAAAYLVERDELAAMRDRTAAFAAANPQLSVLATGPWAPYSFVGDAA